MAGRSEFFEGHKGSGINLDRRTICEVHRQIYDVLFLRLQDRTEVLDEVIPLLEEAATLGIKLVKTLVDRKLELPEWQDNHNPEVERLRLERKRLVTMLNKDAA